MKLDRIYQISIYAQDLNKAVSFYSDTLGAKFLAKYDPPSLVFFDFNGTRLLLEKGVTKGSVYFQVDDIETSYQVLKSKGIKFTQKPHLIFKDKAGTFGDPNQEEWLAFFEDPSGNALALVSRVNYQVDN